MEKDRYKHTGDAGTTYEFTEAELVEILKAEVKKRGNWIEPNCSFYVWGLERSRSSRGYDEPKTITLNISRD
jgi:hypothetical protein